LAGGHEIEESADFLRAHWIWVELVTKQNISANPIKIGFHRSIGMKKRAKLIEQSGRPIHFIPLFRFISLFHKDSILNKCSSRLLKKSGFVIASPAPATPLRGRGREATKQSGVSDEKNEIAPPRPIFAVVSSPGRGRGFAPFGRSQ
jgi:hypothetical protein